MPQFQSGLFLLSFEPNRNQTRTTKLTNKTKYITKMNRKAISIIKMLVIANPASPRWFSPKKSRKKAQFRKNNKNQKNQKKFSRG